MDDAEIDKYLAFRGRKLAKTMEPIFCPFPRREVSPSRRSQLSASAIQRTRLAGFGLASRLHSAAGELNSTWLVIGTLPWD